MVGLQILRRTRQVDARYVQAFADIPVANVSDCMTRMTAGGPRLRPLHKGGRLGGPALTVKCRPGDNLMIHKALDMAVPGDVIVVDAGGDLTNSLVGELMTAYAMQRRLGGMVLNGAVRDIDHLRDLIVEKFAGRAEVDHCETAVIFGLHRKHRWPCYVPVTPPSSSRRRGRGARRRSP